MILLGLLKLLILILVMGFIIGLIVIIGFVNSIRATRDKLMGKSAKDFGDSLNGSSRSRTYANGGQHQQANGGQTMSGGQRQSRAGRKIIADDEGEYVDYEEVE